MHGTSCPRSYRSCWFQLHKLMLCLPPEPRVNLSPADLTSARTLPPPCKPPGGTRSPPPPPLHITGGNFWHAATLHPRGRTAITALPQTSLPIHRQPPRAGNTARIRRDFQMCLTCNGADGVAGLPLRLISTSKVVPGFWRCCSAAGRIAGDIAERGRDRVNGISTGWGEVDKSIEGREEEKREKSLR